METFQLQYGNRQTIILVKTKYKLTKGPTCHALGQSQYWASSPNHLIWTLLSWYEELSQDIFSKITFVSEDSLTLILQ